MCHHFHMGYIRHILWNTFQVGNSETFPLSWKITRTANITVEINFYMLQFTICSTVPANDSLFGVEINPTIVCRSWIATGISCSLHPYRPYCRNRWLKTGGMPAPWSSIAATMRPIVVYWPCCNATAFALVEYPMLPVSDKHKIRNYKVVLKSINQDFERCNFVIQ